MNSDAYKALLSTYAADPSNPTRRELLIVSEAGKAGLRSKIDAMCISCVYDKANPGNWRQQVENCTVTMCPLHCVRPISKPHD